jgi:hypothetical protein
VAFFLPSSAEARERREAPTLMGFVTSKTDRMASSVRSGIPYRVSSSASDSSPPCGGSGRLSGVDGVFRVAGVVATSAEAGARSRHRLSGCGSLAFPTHPP